MFLFDEVRDPDWSPRADVYRTPTGWLIKLDLAGVRPDEVTVEASRHELRVSGVRRDRFVREGYRQHSMEISYSRFERVLRLPSNADHCSLRTEYAEGMLLVILDEER
ncbi:MAG TPA: Hsp20/alpha crystallin family protein [Vicinamibacteria bacterium]|nr:Hsp20/alpha crystallin family protein [Vicinamibacteria bacterium]